MSGNQFFGVIPWAVYGNDTNPIRNVAKEIFHGRKEDYNSEEIKRIVDQRYFGFEPIISLSESEINLLRENMVRNLMYTFNEGTIREFLEFDCYWNDLLDNYGCLHIYSYKALTKKSDFSELRLMTNDQKIQFLENPENRNARWHTDWCEEPFGGMGCRPFKGYSNCDKIEKYIRYLQKTTGKKELHVLDLGGGIGLALRDLKKMHPELVTYNLTLNEEYSHYPCDFHIIGFAERMPMVLKGKIDLIFSNMATRYFAFTDRVIEGCISMLAPGGIMDIFFSSERSDTSDKDVKCRMKKAYDFLCGLKRAGKIELRIGRSFTSNIGGSFKTAKNTLYPAARVFVRKLK